MSDEKTSLTLLDELCQSPWNDSWTRLVALYSPLLKGWLDRHEVPAADADDLIQDVLMVVIKELPRFCHNQRQGAFRSWLRTILVHRLRDYWRRRKYRPVAGGGSDFLRQLDQLEDARSQLSQRWDREHDRHLVLHLLALTESRFRETTRQAFRLIAVDGLDPEQVARELGMTLNAVLIAKSRVLKELRREGKGLLDD